MKPRAARRFEGKVAIVTGAAMGMGATTAEMFAAEGAAITIADIADGSGAETVAQIRADGGRAIFVHTDVRLAADCERCVKATMDTFGRLNYLFNNAGIMRFGTAETMPEEVWDESIDIMLKGTFLMTKYAVPAMRASGGGAIINSGSNCSHHGCPNMFAYSAAKGAMPILTKTMAIDFWPDKIRVNCVSPGFVQTALAVQVRRHQWGREPTPEEIAEWQRPESIAEAVLFLCCKEQAADITGVTLPVSRLTFARSSG